MIVDQHEPWESSIPRILCIITAHLVTVSEMEYLSARKARLDWIPMRKKMRKKERTERKEAKRSPRSGRLPDGCGFRIRFQRGEASAETIVRRLRVGEITVEVLVPVSDGTKCPQIALQTLSSPVRGGKERTAPLSVAATCPRIFWGSIGATGFFWLSTGRVGIAG